MSGWCLWFDRKYYCGFFHRAENRWWIINWWQVQLLLTFLILLDATQSGRAFCDVGEAEKFRVWLLCKFCSVVRARWLFWAFTQTSQLNNLQKIINFIASSELIRIFFQPIPENYANRNSYKTTKLSLLR